MTEIKPFQGIVFDPQKVQDISAVISPPYDVMQEAERDRYWDKDEHNIVRIILGKENPGDNESDNKYSRASGFLSSWLADGILARDKAPTLYVYQQKFTYKKKAYTRKGFIGLLKLDHNGSVKVHENTFAKPKEDRLRLLRATQANTEPIFLTYRGDAASIPDQAPIIDIKDENSVTHRLWRVDDEAGVAEFCRDLLPVDFYIADGHHRYETSINYAKESKVSPSSGDPRNYVMAYFVEESDPGLLVLPIHRMLDISNEDVDLIMKTAKRYFLTVEIDTFEKIEKAVGHVLGFCSKKDGKLYMLKLRDTVAKDRIMKEKGREDVADLDVAILHSLLLDDVLEKYKGNADRTAVTYVHDEKEAIASVRKGKFNCAFLLKPTKVSQIMKIADKGGRMPQKSTFFYPKPYSGLIMRKFD